MRRSEGGYTIVEALFVSVLLIFVLGATLALLDTTAQVAPAENERAHAVREGQQQMDAMIRELRQAHEVVGAVTPSRIEVRVRQTSGDVRRVVYDCTGASPKAGTKNCIRKLYGQDAVTVERTTDAVERVVDPAGPSEPQVFTATQENGEVVFVAVRIEVPASGTRQTGLRHNIVLQDGFLLRNVNE